MEKETCMICLDDLYNGTDVSQTICEHKFHSECLIGYCNSAKSSYPFRKKVIIPCPLCKTELDCKSKDIFPAVLEDIEDERVASEPDMNRRNIQTALNRIDEEEYEFIHDIDDIITPNLKLTKAEKEQVLIEIEKRKKKGGRKTKRKKRKSRKSRRQKRC